MTEFLKPSEKRFLIKKIQQGDKDAAAFALSEFNRLENAIRQSEQIPQRKTNT